MNRLSFPHPHDLIRLTFIGSANSESHEDSIKMVSFIDKLHADFPGVQDETTEYSSVIPAAKCEQVFKTIVGLQNENDTLMIDRVPFLELLSCLEADGNLAEFECRIYSGKIKTALSYSDFRAQAEKHKSRSQALSLFWFFAQRESSTYDALWWLNKALQWSHGSWDLLNKADARKFFAPWTQLTQMLLFEHVAQPLLETVAEAKISRVCLDGDLTHEHLNQVALFMVQCESLQILKLKWKTPLDKWYNSYAWEPFYQALRKTKSLVHLDLSGSPLMYPVMDGITTAIKNNPYKTIKEVDCRGCCEMPYICDRMKKDLGDVGIKVLV